LPREKMSARRAAGFCRDPGLDETAGRGLLLVDALSAVWGSGATDAGKTVWFELIADGGT
jgi:hypothetical protein